MNEFIDRFNAIALTYKLVGLFVVMVGIFVAFLLGVHEPIKEDIVRLENKATELQREAARLDQVRENQAQVVARLEDLNRQLQVAREKLPESAEVPRLLQRIHVQAQTAGLQINRFQRSADVARDDFVEIPVSIEIVGTFDEVANFFYFVGRMTRIVNIQDIAISRASSGLNPDGRLSVSAKATTFRWNPR